MGQHIRMHAVLAAALLLVFGLRWAGVSLPSAVVYLVFLACPLMMVWMMLGRRDHDHQNQSRPDHNSFGSDDPASGRWPST